MCDGLEFVRIQSKVIFIFGYCHLTNERKCSVNLCYKHDSYVCWMDEFSRTYKQRFQWN